MGLPDYRMITSTRELERLCRELAQAEAIALDTEFVAEYTYRPVLCVVQLAFGDQSVLIDALAVERMGLFWEAMAEGEHATVVHAGRMEVEFCLAATRRRLAGLFDVQVAAGLVGLEYPAGYSNLAARVLGHEPASRETRTDWRRRPLSRRQIAYALADVASLLPLYAALRSRLEQLGRCQWMAEEMELMQEEIERSVSAERWRRVSGLSGLDPRALAVARELYAWREEEAARRNKPPRRVLRDDLLVELARRGSADIKHIRAVRGLERPDLKRCWPELAACIRHALEMPEDQCPAPAARRERPEQFAVLGQFLFSALGNACRQAQLAPGLAGTPSDVREWLAWRLGENTTDDRVPRLARGWRREFIGRLLEDLVAGKTVLRVSDPKAESPLELQPAPSGHPGDSIS